MGGVLGNVLYNPCKILFNLQACDPSPGPFYDMTEVPG